MRRVELRTIDLPQPIGAPPGTPPIRFDYAEVISGLLRQAGQGGMPLDQLRATLGVIGEVEAAVAAGRDHLLLEEAGWALLRDRVLQEKWLLVDQGVVDFCDHISSAVMVSMNSA